MFIKDVVQHVQAAFPGLWIETQEEGEFVEELRGYCQASKKAWRIMEWDIASGLTYEGHANPQFKDPTIPIEGWDKIPNPGYEPEVTILVLHGYHAFLADPIVKRVLMNFLVRAKSSARCVMITSPLVQIPVELDRLLVPLSHPLPTRDQIRAIAAGVAEADEYPATPDEESALLDAAGGLTRMEAENSFALSLVEHGKLLPSTIWDLKVATLKKTGYLGLYRGGEKFADLGGLEGMKQCCLDLINSKDDHPDAQPKGILIVGAPGVGKSAFAKALGNEVGWPTITFDFGAIKSKYVGESEAQLRRALAVVDQMSPCILFADEIEKMLSGVGSSNPGDSGVSDSLFGAFITWMNDRKSKVFHVMTANDIRRLTTTNAEFVRSGRFDRVFFVDVPSKPERDAIWKMHIKRFGLPADSPRPSDDHWTGAEIEECCKSARRMYLSRLGKGALMAASDGIVPVAISSRETLEGRRSWADDRYIDAATGRRYSAAGAASRGGAPDANGAPAKSRRVVRSS